MKIINVIVTDLTDGTILSIKSFGIFEPQLSKEITTKAKEFYMDKCIHSGVDSEIAEDSYIDGWCELEDENAVVSIVWSYI